MKASILSALLAIALAASGAAYAAPQTEPNSGVVRIGAQSSYRHSSSEFASYEHTYRLSNGQVVKFTQFGSHFYATVKGEPRYRIFGQSQGVFLSDSGALIEFREGGETLAISNFERISPLAQTGRNLTVFASR
ncbi:hypothetical protein MJ904_03260 [Massilia sp. MB5]|uniref:hypothetical protein n=1 Tax=unclassified Massilia TaxID=2609279 RepID=UPI00067C0AA9|nr:MULTISPECIES: hypothetical protein [unclassified Massilia]AKU23786.1 hypothetical protein ACZ75_22330 [Massilia sp. NR 4-1]UMR31277.1 hypothetical protein MJ904_03260 [Massilia sp. MB5]